MDINKIVQLRLLKNNHTPPNYSSDYRYEIIDINNYRSNLNRLLSVSFQMEKEMEWEGIPNTEEKLYKRFANGSNAQLWIYKDVVIGWCWQNMNLTYDWETTNQILKPNESYTGGAFVSRELKRPPESSFIFYNFSFEYLLALEGKDTVYLYSDSWNRASAQLCYKSGCTKYNFLNETD